MLSRFFCCECGQEGIPIFRKPSCKRERGHLKNLFCVHCGRETNHVEIKENGTISVLPDEGKVLNEVSITTNVPQDNTLKNLLDATKSAEVLFKNYKGTTVDGLIQPNDTENVTNMLKMFQNCNKLTLLDVS